MVTKLKLDDAEAVLTAFARTQLKDWLTRFAPRLNRRRRLIAKRATKTVRVVFDPELDKPDSDIDGYIYYHPRPVVLYVAIHPDCTFPDLVNHELAHFIALLRWRDGGHGRRFTLTLNQIEKAGM